MRLTSIFCRNARAPQNENKVPFKAMLPLKLKNHVSSKNQKVTEHGCLQELSLLITCLDQNEYDDARCIPQFKVLDHCYKTYLKNVKRTQMEQEQVVPVPNSKNLTHKQITHLLRRYPTV
ncbi:coiled-coil-helix-coiled-coil-helix domain-containing protein 1 [Nylanderia fulva]|uniref:coiled-coil-helix-coiled-coil-helix domain-containing protein 1 n=1 Tax=Nylanderia fulva TaxID=613905 RepID=UPI0010FB4FE0|nr:coiled-coil-helix-coiled-coil-helix domain-containing protein 1 [Nylanderia fulva]